MSSPAQALVLHPVSGNGPLTIAVTAEAADELRARLEDLMQNGATEAVPTEDGGRIVVNFGHLVTAHFDALNRGTAAYGRQARTD